MQRKIIGYHQDEEDHWVAELDCFHNQHVRHDPPLVRREWVTTEAGRRAKLGSILKCVRCDQLEMPDDLVEMNRTPTWTAGSVPDAIKSTHTTAPGVWGELYVEAGSLRYVIEAHEDASSRTLHLTAGDIAAIPPCLPHHVEPAKDAVFHVRFLIAAGG